MRRGVVLVAVAAALVVGGIVGATSFGAGSGSAAQSSSTTTTSSSGSGSNAAPSGIHRNPCHDGDVSEQPTEHKILVVDDEPSIVDAVATALRYEGYEVEEAFTGRAALTSVARFEPDLVVLDWMLPDIEGIEVGRRLRAQGFKTAVLFLTAKDATENKVEALRAGGD
ncbi:MAG: response regulator transcription factor, partial [Actinobacteria bacterium]